jgi:hypothetical protein
MESSPTALAQSIAVPIEICQQAIIETLLESMPESLLPHDLQVVPVFDRHATAINCYARAGERRETHL